MKYLKIINLFFIAYFFISCVPQEATPDELAKYYGRWRISIAEVDGVNISGNLSSIRFELQENNFALTTSSRGQIYESEWFLNNNDNTLNVELVLGALLRDNIFSLQNVVLNETEGTITGTLINNAKDLNQLPDEWRDFLQQYNNARMVLRKE